jgi:hypothetical protein
MRQPPTTPQHDRDAEDLTILRLAATGTPRPRIATAVNLSRRTIQRRLAAIAVADIQHDPTAKEHYTWHSPDSLD